jgi:hypothetical protein
MRFVLRWAAAPCALAICAVLPSGAAAAGAVSPPSAEPSAIAAAWSQGVWRSDAGQWFSQYAKAGASWFKPGTIGANPPPLTPAAAARVKEIREAAAKGVSIFSPTTLCHPSGLPYVLARPEAFEIQASPGRINMLFGLDGNYRRIFMDGRGHPRDLEPTYYGHSIGHWEGATLVIDTVGIRGKDTQIEPNIPKTDQMHIVERWTPAPNDRIDVVLTMTDPGVLTAPWTARFQMIHEPSGDLAEVFCTDDNHYREGPGGVISGMTGRGGTPLEKAEP